MTISAIIPTRKRLLRLIKTLESLRDMISEKSQWEAVLRVDDDDHETILGFPQQNWPNVKMITAARRGYINMPSYVADCLDHATGQWCFLIDDDCWIYGPEKMDDLLAKVPTENHVAQCEFYHLGHSMYGSGSCGPNGMIFPNTPELRERMHEKSGSADDMIKNFYLGRGYKLQLLPGLTYRHNRDSEEVLAQRG